MLFIYYFFAAVLILIGFQSLFSGVKYLQYFRSELTKPFPVYTPFVSIIAPCRGLDDDLLENLAAIFQQNYPAYEIIFVVDDINDKAVPIIENLRGKFAGTVKSKIEVAGKATDSGQKVHNLRFAVRKTDLKSEIFVFVDSDARPHKNWLRSLVAPLSDENVGAATGYRWFISKKRNFASELLSVWNASIASALGKNSD